MTGEFFQSEEKSLTSIVKEAIEEVIEPIMGKDLSESFVAHEKKYDLLTDLLSKKTKSSHHELYKSYIEKFNKVSAELDSSAREDLDVSSKYRSLKEDETYFLNSIYLHELYFSNISDVNSDITMDSLPFIRLQRDFGTFDNWQKDFIACCMSSRFGWSLCGFNIFLQKIVNVFIDEHSANVPMGFVPLIVLDMWEHSYLKDYGLDKKSYVWGMMKELDWDVIGERFEKMDLIQRAIR